MATYDPDTSAERQLQDWTCSVRTATWILRSVGCDVTAAQIQDLMVERGLVTPQAGLTDGSGGALAAFLSEMSGLPAHNAWFGAGDTDWDWLQANAGQGPIGLGSGSLYHWLAIRRPESGDALDGMNPAPGYKLVGDEITHTEYCSWAPWAGVWLDVPVAVEPEPDAPAEDPLAACQTALGYLSVDVAGELQKQADALLVAFDLDEVTQIVTHGLQPAIDTLASYSPAGS
jgi:hypothetical protein